MTAANWITLFLPIAGFLFGVGLYVLQKRLDRQNEERRERRELYRTSAVVLQRVHNSLRGDRHEEQEIETAIEALEEAVAEIQVAAPDEVAQSWNDLPSKALRILMLTQGDNVDSDTLYNAEHSFLIQKADAISTMRNDTFGETKVTLSRITEVTEEFAQMADILIKVSRKLF